jgi:hypothetical protein
MDADDGYVGDAREALLHLLEQRAVQRLRVELFS